MNALAHRAPRAARLRPGRHAAPRRLPRVRVPRAVGVLGVSLCCTAGLMAAVRLAATTVA